MTIGSHQTPIGKSQSHLTPRWILDPLGPFFFDPCAASPRPWDIGTDLNYIEADDGLVRPWPALRRGWLNPPFHRHRIGAWLQRMAEHNLGIVLTHVRSETDWYRIIRASASALFYLDRRVIFLDESGAPQRITNPKSKHYGEIANSGAPVMLASYGAEDCDLLASLPERGEGPEVLAGDFRPLIFQRFVLVSALRDATWRDVVANILRGYDGPIAVADLYRAVADHPKTKQNPNWQAKLRQTLQRGAGRSVGYDRWVAV